MRLIEPKSSCYMNINSENKCAGYVQAPPILEGGGCPIVRSFGFRLCLTSFDMYSIQLSDSPLKSPG